MLSGLHGAASAKFEHFLLMVKALDPFEPDQSKSDLSHAGKLYGSGTSMLTDPTEMFHE